MKMYLKTLFTTGVHTALSFSEKRSVIFTNQANVILLICSLLVMMINLLLGYYPRAIVPFSTFFLFLSVFYFQRAQQFQLGQILLVTGAILSGVSATLLFGAEAKTHYYLFASFCLGMVIFRHTWQHLILFGVHLPLFLLLHLYTSNLNPLIEGYNHALLSYLHIPVIFVCIYVTINEFVMNYRRYEERVNNLMDAANEKNDLLEIERSKYKIQSELLQTANNQLIVEVRHKEAIQKELIESNTSLAQFAYVASHDLKEPLRTIGSFTQLLRRKMAQQMDQDTKDYFHFIIDGVARMSTLLDDLLALSSLNKTFEMEQVDIKQCVDLNRLNLKNAIEKNNGTILCTSMPTIHANRFQLNQLFQNLISNGLKFKRDTPPIVEIAYQDRLDDHLFSVSDNGIGISQEYLDKIFVIFQRLNKKEQFEGSGIGLTICKKIVQNHGGKIWVESLPGKGTTFFFTIAKSNSANSMQLQTENIDMLQSL